YGSVVTDLVTLDSHPSLSGSLPWPSLFPYTTLFRSTLLGRPEQQAAHEFLYWEFHEGGFQQAALYEGRWKGIRQGGPEAPLRLYDQKNDIAEGQDVAGRHPDVVAKIDAYLRQARSPAPEWEPIWVKGKGSEKNRH